VVPPRLPKGSSLRDAVLHVGISRNRAKREYDRQRERERERGREDGGGGEERRGEET